MSIDHATRSASTLRHSPAGADGVALGCRVRVVVTDGRALALACRILDAELTRIDLACSRFRADSELAALDRAAGRPMPVSDVLAEAIAVALRAADVTGGAVDPTVGQAMAAVGYDRDFADVPKKGPQIRIVEQSVPGWREVHLDSDAGVVSMPAGVRLDLGATAKALAADHAAHDIAAATGVGVLVSLGGDIAVEGGSPEGGWPVRVQDITGNPDDEPGGLAQTVSLSAGGLATSSTTARRWARGRRELHHIIDPLLGVPAASPWRTVSVAAGSCVDANIASTAAIIRGKQAVAWLTACGVDARLVTHSGDVHLIGRWPAAGAA